MKKILILVLIGILCLILVAHIVFKSKYVVSDDLVGLTVKEESLTKSKATLILKNHTDENYLYGTSYSIEKKIFGIWYILIPKNELSFFLMAYNLEAKESREIDIDWEYHYGKLAPGTYRIIKDVSIKREASTESIDMDDVEPIYDVYITAEFIIK